MASAMRGQIWRVDLDPVRGHEQGRFRPALIVSNDALNASAAGLVTIVPITSKHKPIRSFLKIEPRESGLPQVSYLICDQVRTVSTDRLGKQSGSVPRFVLAEVERRLKFLLDLT